MKACPLIAALLAATAALADEPPSRKSGLWEIKVLNSGAGAQTMQQCIDRKTDDMMRDQARGLEQSACSKKELRREGANLVAESVCKVGSSTATTRAVFVGSFDSAYKVDIRSTYEPPYQGMRESRTQLEARWLGPCKPGQKPGQLFLR